MRKNFLIKQSLLLLISLFLSPNGLYAQQKKKVKKNEKKQVITPKTEDINNNLFTLPFAAIFFDLTKETYEDKHINEINGKNGKLDATLNGKAFNIFYQSDLNIFLELKYATAKPSIEDWKERKVMQFKLGYNFKLFFDIIPYIGLRKITNSIALDQLSSPKLAILDSTDYLTGILLNYSLLNLGGFHIYTQAEFNKINITNNTDYGDQKIISGGFFYEISHVNMVLNYNLMREKYQANKKISELEDKNISVNSQFKTSSISLGVMNTFR